MVGITNWLGSGDGMWHIGYFDVVAILELYIRQDQPPWQYRTACELAQQQSGDLTNWFSVTDDLQHIGFVDINGHVQDLYTNITEPPRWSLSDVTANGGTIAQPGGALTSWWSPGDNTQHIAYIDPRGHVLEVFMHPDRFPWGIRDVTDDTGGHWAQPGALTTWFSTSDSLRHIAYIDGHGHVREAYMHPGEYPWNPYDVTEDTGTPAQPGALTSWWSDSDDTQHIAYINPNGHVLEVFMRAGHPPYGIRDVTDDTGGHWAQPGALTTWFSTSDSLRHIAYIDGHGHVREAYMHPGEYPWNPYDVTEDTGTPAQPGTLTSWWYVGDDTQHIVYLDNDTDVKEAFMRAGQPPYQLRTVFGA